MSEGISGFGFSCGFWRGMCSISWGQVCCARRRTYVESRNVMAYSRVSTLLPFLRSIVAVFFFDASAQLVLSTINWLSLPHLPQQKKGWGQNTGHIVMLGKAGQKSKNPNPTPNFCLGFWMAEFLHILTPLGGFSISMSCYMMSFY